MRVRALIGRARQQRRITDLIDAARRGRSGVLTIRGEAGIGKTALLLDAAAQCADFRILHISGAESEMELAYAAVQQLCAPLIDLFGSLPEPQERALRVAVGIGTGDPPDRLLVGLAVLTLLGEAGRVRPTLCVVDDAQWVDAASLQALAIVARRIHVDSVAMLFAARDRGADRELSGLPELFVNGLDDDDAAALLAASVPGRISDRMREMIILEAAGNPLALQELHDALTPEALAGGDGVVGLMSRADRIEHTYGVRFRALPEDTRTLLLLAAADQAGRPDWFWTAAADLGVGGEAVFEAEEAELITFNDKRIHFRHPLMRAAVYRSAAVHERQRVHAALAGAVDDPAAEDCRTWHLAHAASLPDEHVAGELERSAQRAYARGGVAASASFLAHAARLTPDRARRAERALAAAQANLDAGAPSGAARLLSVAERATDSDVLKARTELVRAKISFASNRRGDAAPLLLAAAKRLEPFDPRVARETYLEAVTAAVLAGRLAHGQNHSALAVAEAARQAPPAASPPRAVDLLLDGLVVRLAEGLVAAAPLLKGALAQYVREENEGTADPRWHDITHRVCLDLLDQETYNFLVVRQVERLRSAGALTVLGLALQTHAAVCIGAGNFDQAATLLNESDGIIAATGNPLPNSVRTYLLAWRGEEQHCRELMQTTIEHARSRGEGFDITGVHYAAATLHNGLGQYEEALAAGVSGTRHDDLGMRGVLLVELIEAAVRCGEMSVARDALVRLKEQTDVSGTPTALGMAARSTALVSDGPAAEDGYREALLHLERSPRFVLLPRTHLIYGEWLRRAKRKGDARVQLRLAYDMFTQMGAEGFAQRARRELRATGEVLLSRSKSTGTRLTAQEGQIASLARHGYTNAEIAGQLFISPRTVEWHLGRIFAKLGVTSRRELRNADFEVS